MAIDQGASSDEERTRRIEELVRRMEQIVDPASREIAEQLMQAVLDLHGSGLEKMMEIVFETGAGGEAIIRKFANDGLVSNLLVLHGLHPDDLETRVRQVLSKAPGHAEVVSVLDGAVTVRLSGESDVEALKALVRDAVPDVTEVVVYHNALNGFVPLASIHGVASRAG